MTIEITDAYFDDNGNEIVIEGIDVSEENLQRFERVRDDGFEQTVTFRFYKNDPPALRYIRKYLIHQATVKRLREEGKPTWGEVLRATIGTITESPHRRYREWSY